MDSLTTHYLARELDARWRGRRVVAAALVDRPRAVTLHVDETPPVTFDLATREPCARWDDPPRDDAHLGAWTVTGVTAPPDERRLSISLERAGRFRGSPVRRASLEVSLIPSARGATLRDAGGALLGAVGSRPRRGMTPRPEPTDEEIARVAGAGDTDAALGWRWMSGHIVAWLMAEPDRAAERYRMMAQLPDARPSRCGERVLPLPLCATPVPVDSLVLPRAAATVMEAATSAPSPRARALVRLRQELERSRDAPRIRDAADRLLALGDVPSPDTIALADGRTVPVKPKPGESAIRAAERLYKAARSLERAAARLPPRIAALEQLGDEEPPLRPRGEAPRARRTMRALPYRRYRSTTGLEILVGRGAQSNDALTFTVAAPDDVWLHARGASGAHVVLRWTRAEPPPPRALEEAAMLAAWHSKARGSAVVPVDWTRRKHVRRARGGSAGMVLVSRAETIMVRPDAAAERALRRAATD